MKKQNVCNLKSDVETNKWNFLLTKHWSIFKHDLILDDLFIETQHPIQHNS